jgi:hypothetical protein
LDKTIDATMTITEETNYEQETKNLEDQSSSESDCAICGGKHCHHDKDKYALLVAAMINKVSSTYNYSVNGSMSSHS